MTVTVHPAVVCDRHVESAWHKTHPDSAELHRDIGVCTMTQEAVEPAVVTADGSVPVGAERAFLRRDEEAVDNSNHLQLLGPTRRTVARISAGYLAFAVDYDRTDIVASSVVAAAAVVVENRADIVDSFDRGHLSAVEADAVADSAVPLDNYTGKAEPHFEPHFDEEAFFDTPVEV